MHPDPIHSYPSHETTGSGGLTPPAKGKTKTFLIGKELKTKDLWQTAAERGERDDNKTQPKTPDSHSQGGHSGRVDGPKGNLSVIPAALSRSRGALSPAGS